MKWTYHFLDKDIIRILLQHSEKEEEILSDQKDKDSDLEYVKRYYGYNEKMFQVINLSNEQLDFIKQRLETVVWHNLLNQVNWSQDQMIEVTLWTWWLP